jgi:cobalt-zinc-cadmium efflux system protein
MRRRGAVRNSIRPLAEAIVAAVKICTAMSVASAMAPHHDHHDPSHRHDHVGHGHAPDDFGFAFALGIALNSMFVAVELVFGYAANSLALVSDAVHNFSDVIALLLAWSAAWLARKVPTQQHTYGYRRASILAALVNAGLLLLAVGGIAVEAINRIQTPAEVAGSTVVLVAALGIVVNGGTALLFMRGRHGDLNIRGAYLHMAADAAVSFGVVVAALVIMFTGWLWVDPAVSLCIAAVVLASGWGLARDSVNLALDGVPRGIELADVDDYLRKLDGVIEVHDLHVWAMSTHETALTAHLVRPGGYDDAFLHGVCEELAHRFNIHHATLQIEAGSDVCRLAPAEVV